MDDDRSDPRQAEVTAEKPKPRPHCPWCGHSTGFLFDTIIAMGYKFIVCFCKNPDCEKIFSITPIPEEQKILTPDQLRAMLKNGIVIPGDKTS